MVLIAPVKPVAGEIIPSSKEDLTIDAASETKSAQSWFARIRFSCFASLLASFFARRFSKILFILVGMFATLSTAEVTTSFARIHRFLNHILNSLI